MRSTCTTHPGRCLQALGVACLVGLSACADDSPVGPAPVTPTATPQVPIAPPGAPATLTLSRPDVVLNALAGRPSSDTATISVTARAGVDLKRLEASIRYGEGEPGDWLDLDVASSATEVGLGIHSRTASLGAGEHRATVVLEVPGFAAESLAVVARVVTTASIGLNAGQICFTTHVGGPLPPKDDVRITSVDGSVIDGLTATIVHDEGQPSGWLTATFDQPVAPARLWLQANHGQLPAGIHTATVLVAAPGAGNSPQRVRVTLTVAERPAPAPSFLYVSIQWQGPQNGGLGQVQGRFGIMCGYFNEGGCVGVLEDGVGTTPLGPNADYGARFVRWEGACTGSGECIVEFTTPGTSKSVTAVFASRPAVLSLNLRGPGASGTVTVTAPWTVPGSIRPVTCRLVDGVPEQACEGIIEDGAGTFTVTATPDPGSIFVYWQVGSLLATPRCGETTPSCTFTISQGGEFFNGIVEFAPASAGAVQVQIEGPGLYVSWMGPEYAPECPIVCTRYFAPGTIVTLRASAQDGATFVEWIGCPAPSGTTCTIQVAENMVVRARFQ